MHEYTAFGLTIQSEIELPPLPKGGGSAPDVLIRHGEVPEAIDGGIAYRNWNAQPDRFLIALGPSSRMIVSRGRLIEVEGANLLEAGHLVSMILGSGLAALLMQRGTIPLHASAIATPKGAVLVMGRSGAGKSTLLTALVRRGIPMLADDVIGLHPLEDGTVQAVPAFPAIRLWKDSLDVFGQQSDGLSKVRSSISKYYLPVSAFSSEPMPVRTIVQLTNASRQDVEIRDIPAENRIECVSRYYFRKQFLKGMQLNRGAFACAAQLARSAQFLRVTRPEGRCPPDDMARMILAHIQGAEAVA
ncbi:HPr kinase [Alteraurantiacibacter aestuarii]|uniref:hypothetical protein n=1 Tax=Alteraurantiacibacter aestuarii TaxID=650004 RepID=UPI0031D63982